jgi:hypothetical protein
MSPPARREGQGSREDTFMYTSTKLVFALGCLACGDDADNRTVIPFAMTDDEQFCTRTHTKHQEALFVGGVIFIDELNAKFVEEYRLGFIKRNLMLFEICSGFGLISFETNHTYVVFIKCSKSSWKM